MKIVYLDDLSIYHICVIYIKKGGEIMSTEIINPAISGDDRDSDTDVIGIC